MLSVVFTKANFMPRDRVYDIEGLFFKDHCSFKIDEHFFPAEDLVFEEDLPAPRGNIPSYHRCSGLRLDVLFVGEDIFEYDKSKSGIIDVKPLTGEGAVNISTLSVPEKYFKGGVLCTTDMGWISGTLTISQYEGRRVWMLRAKGRVECGGLS